MPFQPKIPPSSPILLTITPNPNSNGNVTLAWNEVIGANYYFVYRATQSINSISGLTPITNITNTEYIDRRLTNGTYYYVITAMNDYGVSAISNCESVEVAIPCSPSPPSPNKSNKISGYPNVFIITCVSIGIILSIKKQEKYVIKH